VTDRDIATRIVAKGIDPRKAAARDAMSSPVVTVTPSTDVDDAVRLMEEKQIRRLPVVDENNACCGMVAQADIALRAPREETAELVRDVSKPTRP
jgi:CBS domain-containing protein